MAKEKIITGLSVSEQMSKALLILKTQIIPKETQFQIRKKKKGLSSELLSALKVNA